MAYRTTAWERETLISFDMESPMAYVETENPRIIRQLHKRAKEFPETYQCENAGRGLGPIKFTLADSGLIRFAKPASSAQREAGRKKAHFMHNNLVK
ncbi:MAG: hypothetical protein VB087_05885 [Candidatus Limiplasma sp.]|nr:hypothetical protein [Candidatus Limiplasma sp.]